ncbi:MAG TPA: hypothetical protein VFN10_02140 [Thermoanaerobaculia bacterium]|nr:hypothetical protein [Thermoanaerobaculia bacterium]
MTTPARPILGAEISQPKTDTPQPGNTLDLPIAKDLPPWDLVPSDLLLVRRRPVKK